MFLKEQGKESLNTQIISTGRRASFACCGDRRSEGPSWKPSQLNTRKDSEPGLFTAGRDHPGKQRILSTGIASHGLGKASARKAQGRGAVDVPAVDGVEEVPSNLLLLHCRDTTAFCSTAHGDCSWCELCVEMAWLKTRRASLVQWVGTGLWAGKPGLRLRAVSEGPEPVTPAHRAALPLSALTCSSCPRQAWCEGTAGWGWWSWEPPAPAKQTHWKHLEKCGCP